MIRTATGCRVLAATLLAAVVSPSLAQPFYYVGPSGGDFYDSLNWNDASDGSGSFLAAPVIDVGTMAVEHSLVIDNDSVLANAGLEFGMGSLSIGAGSTLTVGGDDLIFGPGSSLTTNGASLIVNGSGDNGQVQFNNGSVVSLTDTSIVATDDFFFRGQVSIAGSMIESLEDDIEFQRDVTVVSITDSKFLASSTGSGGGLNQVIYFRTSVDQIYNSSFRAGRFGVVTDGVGTTTDIKMTDSTIDVDGDIDNTFSSSNGGVHRLTLAGASTLIADQLETVALFIDDTSSATFFDDADDDGTSWLTSNSLVRLDSYGASVTFLLDETTDVRSRIFDGINVTTYALSPGNFSPSDWDGFSAVTLRLVPEPTGALLAAAGLCLGGLARRVA